MNTGWLLTQGAVSRCARGLVTPNAIEIAHAHVAAIVFGTEPTTPNFIFLMYFPSCALNFEVGQEALSYLYVRDWRKRGAETREIARKEGGKRREAGSGLA